MQVPLMLKYFCITLLCLAIPTCKIVLRWIILAWNIFARVCEMTDCFPSRWSPSPAPTMGLESGCYPRYCTQKGGSKLRYLLIAEHCCRGTWQGTACQQSPGSEDKRTEVRKPRPQTQAPRLAGTPAASVFSASAMMALRSALVLPASAAQWAFLSLIDQEKVVLLDGCLLLSAASALCFCRTSICSVLKWEKTLNPA